MIGNNTLEYEIISIVLITEHFAIAIVTDEKSIKQLLFYTAKSSVLNILI